MLNLKMAIRKHMAFERSYISMLAVQFITPLIPLCFVYVGRVSVSDAFVGTFISEIAKEYMIAYLCLFGFEKIIMRESAREGSAAIFSITTKVLVLSGTLGIALNILMVKFFQGSRHDSLFSALVYLGVLASITISGCLIGAGHPKLGVFFKQGFLYLIATVCLLSYDWFFVAFQITNAFLYISLLLFMYLKKGEKRPINLKERNWFYGESILIAAQGHAMPIIINSIMSPVYVTAFFAYSRIASFVAFSGSALINYFYKDAIFLKKTNIEAWKLKVKKARSLMNTLGLVMFAFGFIISGVVFKYFSSTTFHIEIAVLLLGAQYINMAVGPTGLVMIASEKQNIKFAASLLGLLSMLSLVAIIYFIKNSVSFEGFIISYCLSILVPAFIGSWVMHNELRK